MSQREANARRYRFDQNGSAGSNTANGVSFFRDGVVDTWGLSWADNATTTIRILPVRNLEDPNRWEPYRFTSEPNNFGDWLRSYPAVRKMGDPAVSFIYHDPNDQTIDPAMTPGWVLYRAVDSLVQQKADPGWGGYLRGGANRGAQLSKPNQIYFLQCVIVAHKGKNYSPWKGSETDTKPMVLALSKSAAQALITQLNEVMPGYNGDPNDFSRSMKYGDPVAIDKGAFVTFYRIKDGDPRTRGQQSAVPQQAAFGGASARQSQEQDEIGYECFIEPSYAGMSSDLSMAAEQVRSKVKAWDDIIRIPTLEEQAMLLAGKFPPNMILYAWRDHPEWIPEHVRRAAVNPVSAVSPGIPGHAAVGFGGVPQPGYQQPVPAYQPAPAYQQPAPAYQQPAPAYQQPAPAYQQPAPAYQQPAPAYQQPAPAYQQPGTAPAYQQPAGGGYQPDPNVIPGGFPPQQGFQQQAPAQQPQQPVAGGFGGQSAGYGGVPQDAHTQPPFSLENSAVGDVSVPAGTIPPGVPNGYSPQPVGVPSAPPQAVHPPAPSQAAGTAADALARVRERMGRQ